MNTATRILSIDSRATGNTTVPAIANAMRAWGIRLGGIVWCELQAFGARRALREMRLMGIGEGIDPALLHEGQPADRPARTPPAGAGNAVAMQQAAAVRAMARRRQLTDPGFAADLLAAADRHEARADASGATAPAR